jgi:hypothetical protein
MNRKTILEVVLVLFAALIVSAVCLVGWIIMLIPFLIKPALVKPLADRASAEFTTQFARILSTRRRKTKDAATNSV